MMVDAAPVRKGVDYIYAFANAHIRLFQGGLRFARKETRIPFSKEP